MSLTEAAAWWGALTGTAVLIWDIVKHTRSGARLWVNAAPDMQGVNMPGIKETQFMIFVEANNVGDRSTTITHLLTAHYKNLWEWVWSKPSHQAAVINPGPGLKFPHVLEPGQRWTGLVNQDDLVSQIGFSGYLYCGIVHSSKKKPIMVRVIPTKSPGKAKPIKVT